MPAFDTPLAQLPAALDKGVEDTNQDKTDWYIRLDARRFCVDWRPAQVCCQGGKAETGP